MSSTTGIGGVSANNYTQTTAAVKTTPEKTEENAASKAAASPADSYVKTEDTQKSYKYDANTVNALKSVVDNQKQTLRAMVEKLLSGQANQYGNSIGINIDPETRAEAASAIAEDGEWGVKAVSERILDFAKAISGGDPDKIETLRGAIEKGFKNAEKLWGGKLPEISQQTYDAVMKGLDDWKAQSTGTAAQAAAVAAQTV